MMDFGRTAWLMVMADLFMPKVMSMRENGLRTKPMATELTPTSTDLVTRASGSWTSSMDMELSSGPMAQNTRETMSKE